MLPTKTSDPIAVRTVVKATYLLWAASQVEHALMVQYLYAGYGFSSGQREVLDVAEGLADPDEATGARLVAQALTGPIMQIAVNAGLEGGVAVARVKELSGNEGLNAATGEYEDLVAAGIIDAAKVTRSALQNAASIAALFLTTEAIVTDAPIEDDHTGHDH